MKDTIKSQKCSLKGHQNTDAIYYCNKCNIYMCNPCQNLHLKLFPEHQKIKLDKNQEEIFTGLCLEKGHHRKLSYFCKTYNKLCCAACISKIKYNEYGEHKDCEICTIDEIKEEKNEIFKKNIENMNSLLNTIQNSINELENIYNEIHQSKEELKIKIMKIFTKLNAALNKREDEIISDIEKKFSESYFDENIIKQGKKLPQKIKAPLDKAKIIEEKWKNNEELCYVINDSLEIEKDNANIKEINENINKCNGLIVNIYFRPNEKGIMEFINSINNFGTVEIYKGKKMKI